MDFLDKRIEVIAKELKQLSIMDTVPLNNWQMKKGFYRTPEEATASDAPWQLFDSSKDIWTGNDAYFWFRTTFDVPESFAGKHLQLRVASQIESPFYAMNPQFLVFVDGTPQQGADINHKDIFLTYSGESGRTYTIDLQAYTGTEHSVFNLFCTLEVLDAEIEGLSYDLLVPLEGFSRLDADSEARIELERTLNTAVNLLDLRCPYSEQFSHSVREARTYLDRSLYSKDTILAPTASVIGHTHIDVAWLWTVEQTKAKVARSFSTVLGLMKEYPDYRFMSSQPVLYSFLKDHYPMLYAEVQERIKEGRWECEGGMYLEADCNLTSGESLVRQFLYGKRFFKEEFAKESTILWLPDVFGYSGALPQILKKCGIKYFMTTKINWNQFDRMPHDTFMWKGIDGSEILTYFITTPEVGQSPKQFFTTYNGRLHPDAVIGAWRRYQDKAINNDILICYGYGDGGGGPTKEMLETARRMEKGLPGMPRVKQTFVADYFQSLDATVKGNRELATWEGELYFEYHRGTLTSMGRNKRGNRKSEFSLMDLELLDVLSGNDHVKEREKLWKKVLVNQFHDILPGSSIKGVYDVTKVEYEELENSLHAFIQEDAMRLVEEDPAYITILNTTGFERHDLVYVGKDIQGLECDDAWYPAQNGYCYVTNIPSKGYRVFQKTARTETSDIPFEFQSSHELVTPYYRVKLSAKGTISELYDVKNNRNILKKNTEGNRMVMFEDKPMNYDNWDIDIYYTEKYWEVETITSFAWVDVGPLYATLKVEKVISKSTITQWITFYAASSRIDFKNSVDWKESQCLLKVFFDADVHTDEATFDIQSGAIKRKTHQNTSWDKARFESCGQKFVDVSERRYGVALLNDCKYGHSVRNGEIGLSLIKSGIYPNPDADKETHEFKFSLFPHEGDLSDSDTLANSYFVNQDLLEIEGKAPERKFSFVSSDCKNVVIETVKRSEDGSGVVIRVYESENALTKFNLTFSKAFRTAFLTNLLEEDALEVAQNSDVLSLEIKPYEVLTIKIEE
ncbi:MAG: alpha-mannosidase [Clostridia bacterium]|nr:alpha-mannosidase [Clostridia bacterium]